MREYAFRQQYRRTNMLDLLHKAEEALPALLRERSRWQGIFIAYHPPFVERVWCSYGELRIYLHRIFPCEKNAALLHPHPWPSAMRILDGTYEMGIGYSSTTVPPPLACTLRLKAGSEYEMTNEHGWHYVLPLERPSLSLMVTGTPWQKTTPKQVMALEELPEKKIVDLMELFSEKYA